MKKMTKKVLAIAITVLMFMSVMGVQSFAAFDFLKAPVIEKVELSQDSTQVVSLKEVKAYFEDLDEVLDELREDYGVEEIPEYMKEWLYNFYLSDSNLEYAYDVTLSNGEKYTVKSTDYYNEINAFYTLDVDASVNYDDYLAAVKSSASSVKLKFEADVFSVLADDYVEDSSYSSTSKIKVVDCIVKSIAPVSGVPSKLPEDIGYVDLDGASVKIKYADGTVKTEKIVQSINLEESRYYADVTYTLDGKPLYVGEYEGELSLYFLDAEYTKKITYSKSLIKGVEITNCDFDYTKGLKSISYKITWTNGTVKEYTKEFTGEASVDFYKIIDCIDGYCVSIDSYDFNDDSEDEEDEELKLRIFVSVGDKCSKGVEYDVPASGVITFFSDIIEKISAAVDYFRNFIYVLIGMMFD